MGIIIVAIVVAGAVVLVIWINRPPPQIGNSGTEIKLPEGRKIDLK